MPEQDRILTSPVRLTGELHLAHLATLASVDALLRRARSEGAEVAWQAATLAGDLGSQALVERELTREGTGRSDLGRDAFVDRVRAQEAEARERVSRDLAAAGIVADLGADALDTDAAVVAARTAFVRLYEAGLLTRQERVVATCPRCRTVVDPADALPAALEAEVITLKLGPPETTGPQVTFEVEVDLIAPELLPGVVAVAVPEDHPAAGSQVEVPVARTVVPVIADASVETPELVIPSHDQAGLELARRHGLLPVDVLDGDGVVRAEGPLQGLARFAARAAARQLITADGDVLVVRPGLEPSDRCRRCGTVLVPRRGRHWFLPMADLEVGAADAVRESHIDFAPPSARDELIARAGLGGDWCLSHQVWAGQPVPVAACLDCGQLAVSVEASASCGKCMGTLVAEDDVLDARFVGAVWPLATAGWPASEKGPSDLAPDTTLVVGPSGVVKWVLPMAALGVWLAGVVPFCNVAVHHVVATEEDPDPRLPVDLAALVAEEGPRVVRAALLLGGLDLAAARALVAGIDDPPLGAAGIDDVLAAYDAAFAAGTPGDVIPMLAGTLDEGISPDAVDRVKALAAPLLGD
ncbi:MAG: valyl-tRNA synthetase [Actinomycetota bacterium]|nr:valyl-tRNA synthetase [Actinomycetota bacterium]